jgi:hypothetical protein
MVRCREGIELSAFSRRLGPETARCWLLAPRDRFFGEWIDFSAYVMRGHWSVAEGLSHAKRRDVRCALWAMVTVSAPVR